MTELFSREERENLKEILTEGLLISEDMDIPDLTIRIWEEIAKLPHPMGSTFNLVGNSSIINIVNEAKDGVVNIHIKPDELYFELTKPEYKYAQSDRVTIAFGVMATMKAWSQTQLM